MSLHVAHPQPCEQRRWSAQNPSLQLTRKQLQEVVGIVAAHHQRAATAPAGGTLEMTCIACQSPGSALDVTLEPVNLILCGDYRSRPVGGAPGRARETEG